MTPPPTMTRQMPEAARGDDDEECEGQDQR